MAQAVVNRAEELQRLWDLALSLVEEDKEVAAALKSRSEPENLGANERIEAVWLQAKRQILAQTESHIARVDEHRKVQQEALDFWSLKKQCLIDQTLRVSPQFNHEVCDQFIAEYTAKVLEASRILAVARQNREVVEALPDYPFGEA